MPHAVYGATSIAQRTKCLSSQCVALECLTSTPLPGLVSLYRGVVFTPLCRVVQGLRFFSVSSSHPVEPSLTIYYFLM